MMKMSHSKLRCDHFLIKVQSRHSMAKLGTSEVPTLSLGSTLSESLSTIFKRTVLGFLLLSCAFHQSL